MSHKIKTILITFIGYSLLLFILCLEIVHLSEYKILEKFTLPSVIPYIILNGAIFTFLFGLFRDRYVKSDFKKRIGIALFVYIAFIILATVITLFSSIYFSYLFTDGASSISLKDLRFIISMLMVVMVMSLGRILIFGLLTFGFTEILYTYVLKKNTKNIETNISNASKEKKTLKISNPYIKITVVSIVPIFIFILILMPKYRYYKTEKIPDTNLQVVIYLQSNYITGFSTHSDFAYTPAYIELQNLQGKTLAKRYFFNRCTVQIGDIFFDIEDNKLYFTKFSYIDLSDYSYYCFK